MNAVQTKITLVTPKNVIQIVIDRKTKSAKLNLYETRLQKRLFFAALTLLVLGAALGIITNWWHNKLALLVALCLLLLSAIVGLAYQAANMLPELARLRNVEREIAHPFFERFDADVDLIQELSQFDDRHLRYAATTFDQGAVQLRERIGVLVGALDKVGVVPIAITAYISYAKVLKEGLQTFSGVEWVGVALIFLYLFAIRMVSAAQWMERIAALYTEALTKRSDIYRSHPA